jgi:hypothetical protein
MPLTKISQTMVESAPVAAKYIGFYNGRSDYTTPANLYNIGVAEASDPLSWARRAVIAPLSDDVATYKDSSGHQNPHPIKVGDEIWVYYEGYDGTSKHIFMFKTDLDGRLIYKPLMPVIDVSAVAGASSISRPAVLYDPDDATWPFKMVFSKATTGNTPTSLISARSKDGLVWTLIGEIINVSGGAAWENTYVETTGRLLKDGSVYRLFYGGHNGTYWRGGEIHTSDFATWTKSAANPLLQPRGGLGVALTANASPGTKTLKVANSALFDAGAPIVLYYTSVPSSGWQTNVIDTIVDATTISLKYALQGNYTTAIGSKISQMHAGSVEFSEIWFEGGKWKTLVTCFQFMRDENQLIETMGYAESPDLNTKFTIVPSSWPLTLMEKRKTWDQRSAENVQFVRVL